MVLLAELVCPRCVVVRVVSYRVRVREQQNMVAYLSKVVWPGVAPARLQVLRGVLYGPPFKIRSPEELVKHAARLAHSVIDVVADDLLRRRMDALTDSERQCYLSFVETRCDPASSTFDSLSTPSVVYQPATKMRIVGE